ncbi:TetR/AcrR family transcriptional regulator [uncultured Tessaracoccus sp.]|uniref:TetR/AcrR family transcriptional regulator n=1 Tax=uncultured Tessaracoccus sp. TaxID=905023 RepID=UPI0025F47999|nr:TetR/AcrR family transcriptional regulator [uncultured Tessaracoccus sp.]
MDTPVDGRTTRWQAHNEERRRELVVAALRAIRRHGATVGMDEIAHEAGTSKPVVYRHFGDKAGLYQAIVDWVNDFIWGHLNLEDPAHAEPRELVRSLADTYLTLVERDPEVYQFVISRPLVETPMADPVVSITTRIGNRVAEIFRDWLDANGLDTEPAYIFGHGVVGFTWATADRWIITHLRRPRPDVVDYIDQLFTPAFEGLRRAG